MSRRRPPIATIDLAGDAGHYASLARCIQRDLANGPTGREESDVAFLSELERECWRQARALESEE